MTGKIILLSTLQALTPVYLTLLSSLSIINENDYQLQGNMRLKEKKVIAVLKQHGYKLTPQRRLVVRAIASARGHITSAAIYKKVCRERPDIGLVTVYRTLEILTRLKVICELHAGGNSRSYTVSATGKHHHLVCARCGDVVDFPWFVLEDVERDLYRETGFKIDESILEFSGLCQSCQGK